VHIAPSLSADGADALAAVVVRLCRAVRRRRRLLADLALELGG
jgi:hypothetical protein